MPNLNQINGAEFGLPKKREYVEKVSTILDYKKIAVSRLASVLPEKPEQIIARLDNAIERHIQSVIDGLGYVSIERLAIYVNSTNAKWKAEALGAPLWITAVWEKAIDVMNSVKDGFSDVPTESELIALMPKLEDFVIY